MRTANYQNFESNSVLTSRYIADTNRVSWEAWSGIDHRLLKDATRTPPFAWSKDSELLRGLVLNLSKKLCQPLSLLLYRLMEYLTLSDSSSVYLVCDCFKGDGFILFVRPVS